MQEALTAPIVFQVAGLVVIAITLLTTLISFFGVVGRALRGRRQRVLDAKAFEVRLEEARALVQRKKRQAELSWQGWRKFRVSEKIPACEDGGICSFHLRPHDGRPLPEFKPGQFLTFELDIPGQKKPVIRCYSLSDSPREEYFRVSIKKLVLPERTGLGSGFFHDSLKVGDLLDVKAPAGNFFLEMAAEFPVVLIGGGVGITPMVSMFASIAQKQPDRQTWLFYGVRAGTELIERERLEALAAGKPNMRVIYCYSNPTEREMPLVTGSAAEYQSQGKFTSQVAHAGRRIGLDLIKRLLPTDAQDTHQFYICGPGRMMEAVTTDLAEWGVPKTHVHTEAFGPSSVSKTKRLKPDASGETPQITFAKSGKTAAWDPDAENVLNFAEANDVTIKYQCRVGNCGECETAVRSGEVSYLVEPGWKPAPGCALLCVSEPSGNLTLDA